MIVLRSLTYWLFLVVSAALFSCAILLFCKPDRFEIGSRLARSWARWNLAALNLICGLGFRISGQEHLPETTAVVLCKHQSAWETIALRAILPLAQTWVLKEELLRVPIFGAALRCFSPIAVDRSAGPRVIRRLLSEGRRSLNAGRWIIVYPEGTRVPLGERRAYNIGGALLAERAGYPVVPIAHNAGAFWGRRSLSKKPGVIDLVIGPVILAQGQTAAEINRQAEEWIEATVADLFSG